MPFSVQPLRETQSYLPAALPLTSLVLSSVVYDWWSFAMELQVQLVQVCCRSRVEIVSAAMHEFVLPDPHSDAFQPSLSCFNS
jgi:hypothetical protein